MTRFFLFVFDTEYFGWLMRVALLLSCFRGSALVRGGYCGGDGQPNFSSSAARRARVVYRLIGMDGTQIVEVQERRHLVVYLSFSMPSLPSSRTTLSSLAPLFASKQIPLGSLMCCSWPTPRTRSLPFSAIKDRVESNACMPPIISVADMCPLYLLRLFSSSLRFGAHKIDIPGDLAPAI